ncbi:hypothetical protein [Methanoculleus frigidifontis]|uniref:hypothetical protein n=1 Tax=Methanoculleus frigidifontis TaxID=2584085 RepID=UPI00265910EA|nr:hypothetical protein [Methanoculleus sp. FWC-SCC1]
MKINSSHSIRCAAAVLVLCVIVAPAAALNAQVSQPILPKGIPLSITGQTDFPGEIAVWIVGRTVQDRRIITAPDGTFAEELFPANATSGLRSGQYFLIIEDTGPDAKFALETAADDGRTVVYHGDLPLFALDDPETGYSDTAMALSEALDRPDIDDAATTLVFLVEEPWMRFDQVPSGHPGDRLRFAGSTNLPPGSEIAYTVFSVSANPGKDDKIAESGSIKVVKGGGHNYWYFDIDTGGLEIGEYVMTLDSGLAAATATTVFTLHNAGVSLPATPGITMEMLQEEPEEISAPPIGPEPDPAETADPGVISTTERLISTIGSGVSAIDGDYIVWVERTEEEKTNIFLYDIPTGTTRMIAGDADYRTSSIDISGDRVAWEISRPDASVRSDGIGLYTIPTGVVEKRPLGEYLIIEIAMDGDLIVFSAVDWSAAGSDGSRDRDILLYSISNNTTQILCNESGHQIEPAINEGYVAWRDSKGAYADTVTICSLADFSRVTLRPAAGSSYGTPSVGGGMVVSPLHHRTSGTTELCNTEIVMATLPGMETTTLALPEMPRRYHPQSNGEWTVWEERDPDSAGLITVLYDMKAGTVLKTWSGGCSGIDRNHIIVAGSDGLRLITVPGDTLPDAGGSTGAGALPDAPMIGFSVMVAGMAAVAALWMRGRR